jgi:short-subunit dehydrogenase involved in D-alanine esterification of teichoic acids
MFANKVVVVTAGSHGNEKALTRALLKVVTKVAIYSRNCQKPENLASATAGLPFFAGFFPGLADKLVRKFFIRTANL